MVDSRPFWPPDDPLALSEPDDNAVFVALDPGDLDAGTDRSPFTG